MSFFHAIFSKIATLTVALFVSLGLVTQPQPINLTQEVQDQPTSTSTVEQTQIQEPIIEPKKETAPTPQIEKKSVVQPPKQQTTTEPQETTIVQQQQPPAPQITQQPMVSQAPSALSSYAACLNEVTALIQQMRAQYAIEEKKCNEENRDKPYAPLLCHKSIDNNLLYSACTGKYEVSPSNNPDYKPYQPPTYQTPPLQQPNNDYYEFTEQLEQERRERQLCEVSGGTYYGSFIGCKKL